MLNVEFHFTTSPSIGLVYPELMRVSVTAIVTEPSPDSFKTEILETSYTGKLTVEMESHLEYLAFWEFEHL